MAEMDALPVATLVGTMIVDGDDPWWAVAATHSQPRTAAARRDVPRTAAAPPAAPAQQPTVATYQRPPSTGDDFTPLVPKSLAATGIGESQVEALVLKFLLNFGSATGREIADQVRLPFPLITELLQRMKSEQLLVYKSSTALHDYAHELTPLGCERGRRYSEVCTYFGSAPVSLADYTASIMPQSLRRQHPTANQLRRALSDLVVSRELFCQLGQALWAGTAMFLYGDSGNGKTSIAERVTQAFGPYIWIPRCISIWGEIVRLYDASVHEAAPLDTPPGVQSGIDERWIRIRRPTIVAGGELTLSHLEMTPSGTTGIIEAPLHMKSNGGTLVIDDFGRQRLRTEELLNRWIVPLEKRYDYLTLPSGRKIEVPFEQLVVFATNLEPRDLVDEAFLRRIPYKIEVRDPSEEEFRELMRMMAPKLGVEYREAPVDYLLVKHYHEAERRMRYCHPRDLLLQVRNFCLFHEMQPAMSNEALDAAATNYFAIM
ncbi:MAG: AAA family ATPase [Planctomycetia bacterium]|nr:AAA family ATPase [Planctomycetia bacterium]